MSRSALELTAAFAACLSALMYGVASSEHESRRDQIFVWHPPRSEEECLRDAGGVVRETHLRCRRGYGEYVPSGSGAKRSG